jgi:hypothetical protein
VWVTVVATGFGQQRTSPSAPAQRNPIHGSGAPRTQGGDEGGDDYDLPSFLR